MWWYETTTQSSTSVSGSTIESAIANKLCSDPEAVYNDQVANGGASSGFTRADDKVSKATSTSVVERNISFSSLVSAEEEGSNWIMFVFAILVLTFIGVFIYIGIRYCRKNKSDEDVEGAEDDQAPKAIVEGAELV